jgi:uncharacterized protein (DUF1330 family)
MGTYLINHVRIRNGIAKQEALAQLKRTIESHGGRWYSYDKEPSVDGGQDNSRVLVEFPNMMAAENWYNSSDYLSISQTYVANSIDLALVDGINPDFTMAGFAQTSPSSPLFVKCNTARRC